MTKNHVAYLQYLDTPEWWSARRRALERAGYCCERCGGRATVLDVHHAGYENLGAERPDDLVVLCRPCHRAEHAPRNRTLRERERFGQVRLFERFDEYRVPYRRAA